MTDHKELILKRSIELNEAGLSTGMANMTWLALNLINENDLP